MYSNLPVVGALEIAFNKVQIRGYWSSIKD